MALVAASTFLPVREALEFSLAWIDRLGPWGPALFILFYAVAAVLFVPGSVLTLGAGALFGVLKGSICVSIASTLGATAAFLIGRHLARAWVARVIAGNERFVSLDNALAAQGWKIVGLVRLSPVFPFSLLNYAFGLTRVTLRDYVVASWIGMMPGTVMYVYLGSLAEAGLRPRSHTSAEWALYGIGLLATVGVTLAITRIAKQALATRMGNNIS